MLPPSSIQEASGLRGLGRACIPTRLGNRRTDEIAAADHRSRGVALCQCRPPCIFLSHQTAAASCIKLHSSSGEARRKGSFPVMTQHYAMLQRNLLYTGVTRGKRLVVLVGQKKAVAIAVRDVSGRRRWSKLAEWLSGIWGSP